MPSDPHRRAALEEELRRLYASVDAEMAKLPFACRRDAHCCREAQIGPKPYPLEVMLLQRFLEAHGRPSPGHTAKADPCPFLQGNSCSVYAVRPFNCRTFTCDGSSLPIFESWKGRLADLCRQFLEFDRFEYRRAPLRSYFPWPKGSLAGKK